MQKSIGYVLITAMFVFGAVGAFLYIRGGRATVPAWSGGTIRVGYSSEPPYAVRLADGRVTGEAPEIAKAVLARMGVSDIRFVLLDFTDAIGALREGQIDMIANGLFITPERSAKVTFSLPFSVSGPGLLVRLGNPKGLHSYEEVADRPDITVAVLDGSVEQQLFERLGVAPGRLFAVPDPAGGLAAVRTGRVDCLALSQPSVAWLSGEARADVEAVKDFHTSAKVAVGQSAFAFRVGDTKLIEAVNAALRQYIGTEEHLRTVAPFGFGPDSLPQWSR